MSKYRAGFISDIHLGSRSCQAEAFLDWFKDLEFEYLYLVGDIVDVWALQKKRYWPESHNTVVQKLLRAARSGTKVTYIPGNHDADFRQYVGYSFGDLHIKMDDTYTYQGKSYVVAHGDQFDMVSKYGKFLEKIGGHGYDWLIYVNRIYNKQRRAFGLEPQSFSKYVKRKVKGCVQFVSDYEKTVSKIVDASGADGLICGHIHQPSIQNMGNFLYLNCGDWVESCTALTQDYSGKWKLHS